MSSTTIATATAVLQFVGIVLFTRELSPDQQLIGLMPRISGHAHVAARNTSKVANRQRREAPAVEEHAAFLAFPAGDYISSKGWPPSGLETADGYLFLRLDGEHIQFSGGGRYIQTRSSASITRETEVHTGADTMALPHLQPCCKGAALKPQFQAPDYSGAVAVFHLPSLQVKGCNANSKAENVNTSRIDSRTTIENNGVLVISATRKGQKKEIRLQGNTTVIVAHLPMDAITGMSTDIPSAGHYQAYYDMIEEGNCGANEYRTCAAEPAATEPCLDKSLLREAHTQTQVGTIGSAGNQLPWFQRTDFECSNTQWP